MQTILMVRFSYLLFLIGITLILSLTFCNRDKQLAVPEHPMLTLAEFNQLSRIEQVKMCGSCHPKQYESEMKGPHANAYKMLEAHFNYIGSDTFDMQEYCVYIDNKKGYCTGCHASTNVFEDAFAQYTDDEEGIAKLLAKKNWAPSVRKDSKTISTGIDCITCHYDGNGVVASLSAQLNKVGKTSNCPTYCSPRPSAILSSNVGCITCHAEQVQQMNTTFVSSAIKSTECTSCHAQHDAAGKSTHYYYWAHDPADKPKPAHLDMFSGIECSVNETRDMVNVKWSNTLLPHPVSICTELKARISVYNAEGKLVAMQTINANRKPEQDGFMQPYFKGAVPGNHSFTMGGNTKPQLYSIGLPITQTGKLKVVIDGLKKEQYWLSDSLGTPVHHRELSL